MDKQGIIVIALILLAWVGYQTLHVAPREQAYLKQLAEYQAAQKKKAEEAKRNGVAAPGSATPTTTEQPAPERTPDEAPPAPTNPRHTGLAFDTPQHDLTLTTEGASVETLTFKTILDTPYVLDAPEGHDDDRKREPLMLLKPFKGITTRSFALEPTDPAHRELARGDWAHEKVGAAHRFSLKLPNGIELVKTYSPPTTPTASVENGAGKKDEEQPPLYHFDLTVEVRNTSAREVEFGYRLLGSAGMVDDSGDARTGGITAVSAMRRADNENKIDVALLTASDAATAEGSGATDALSREITFYGSTSKYFAAVVIPQQVKLEGTSAQSLLRSEGKQALETDPLYAQVVTSGRTAQEKLAPGASRTDRYMVYVGPKQKAVFEAEGTPYVKRAVATDGTVTEVTLGLEKLIDFGWFEFMARILLVVLGGFHAIVGNWGVAIIMLTFLVRSLLLPLSIWSQKNMLRMQKLAPELNKLKEKYTRKDGTMTPEAQRQFSVEQMELMRKTGVNPVGCIGPIFLQLPVFIGLWNALNYAFELRGQPFGLWIDDLSVPEVLFRLPFTLPLWGTDAFSLLPLIMVATYALQMWMQPMPTDPRAAEQQRMMKWIMPTFGLMLYSSPSGLMLYFITSSLWTIVETKQVKKHIEKTEGPMPGAVAPVMP